MSEEITKKKRIRAGHKASAARIITQVKEGLATAERNVLRLDQQRQKLKMKYDDLRKLDSDILDSLESEDDITNEIEQTDLFNDEIELTILLLDEALSKEPDAQPRLTENPREEDIDLATGNKHASAERMSTTRSNTTLSRARERESSMSSVSSRQHSPAEVPSCAVKLPKLTLKEFGGDVTTWGTFWDSFESAIHGNPKLSAIDKFNYLHSLVKGSAAEAIAGLALTSSNYEEAVILLKKRFGNKQQQINKHMEVLLNLEPVTSSHNTKSLRHLYDKVETQVRCLRSLGVTPSSYGSVLASILMSKIPHDLCLIVSREVSSEEWEFETILSVIEREVEARERAVDSSVGKKPSRERPTTASLLANGVSGNSSCCYCSDSNHSPSQCVKVTDVEARKTILMKTGMCFVCLKRNHKAKECRSSMTCSNCRKRHHASICGASSRATTMSTGTRHASSVSSQSTSVHQPSKTSTSQNNQSSVLSMFIDVRTPVLLQTARTVVYKPVAPAVAQTTRIIFDTGSQRSYIASRVRNMLELLTERTETLVVKTFGSKAGIPQACDVVNVALKTRSGDDVVIPLLTVPTICKPLSGQPVTLASQRYSYLSKLDLADPSECGDCLDVGILVGADHYWALVTGRTRQGAGPTAIETRLGWVLSGPVTGLCSESSSVNALSCHVLRVEASQHGCSNASLDQALK